MKKLLKISNLVRFSELLNQFRKVDRITRANGLKRDENDMEHSYMLAMLAWYIISSQRLRLNVDKVIGYALVHDLVEAYAGDTFFYNKDPQAEARKKIRERDAAVRIKREFSEFAELHALIHDYEARYDKESRFVYALDKFYPALLIYMDGGHTWRREKISLKMLKEKKVGKISIDDVVSKYFDELVSILEKNEKKLFGRV